MEYNEAYLKMTFKYLSCVSLEYGVLPGNHNDIFYAVVAEKYLPVSFNN
jgi:hypothetical protein